MIKFCKFNNEILICDEATINKFDLKVIKEISEEELSNNNNKYYIIDSNIILGENPKDKLIEEYNNLRNWFDIDYTRKEQKYRRLEALGDTSASKSLIELYKEGEDIRKRIQLLETLI